MNYLIAVVLFLIPTLQAAQAQPGAVDLTFDATAAVTWNVDAMVRQPDGKVLLGRAVYEGSNPAWIPIVRVGSNGAVDPDFALSPNHTNLPSIHSMLLQSNGQILVVGYGNGGIARLNSDGSLDTTFVAKVDSTGYLVRALEQADNKLIVVGPFTSISGNLISNVARLMPDGGFDSSFRVASSVLPPNPYAVAVQPDGKLLLGGGALFLTNHAILVRINEDGNMDNTFVADLPRFLQLQPFISVIKVLTDGRLLVGGEYSGGYGSGDPFIVRLMPNGKLDPSFAQINPPFAGLGAIEIQPNGKLLLGGYYDSDAVGNTPLTLGLLLRANSDETTDNSFNQGVPIRITSSGFPSIVSLIYLNDGKVLIGGHFNYVSDVLRHGVARVQAWELVPLLNPVRSANAISFSFLTESQKNYELQYRSNLATGNWTYQSSFTGNGGSKTLMDTNIFEGQRFYRVIVP